MKQTPRESGGIAKQQQSKSDAVAMTKEQNAVRSDIPLSSGRHSRKGVRCDKCGQLIPYNTVHICTYEVKE
ncbi:MAG: hypothetical protein DRP42_05440 [Tenericutes bacterium]|nr:MAG: hypothetical protein DRP42_05440 [Mycoplasmatota bacterium]